MAGNITTAYNYVIQMCNAKNVGYSQDYRNRQTVNGITYFDCSSLMWYGLLEGGFDVVGAYESALWGYEGNAVTTHYLAEWLFALGFDEIDISAEWKAGDILWRDGHTEMVYNGRVTMGAHSSRYALADQVSINTTASSVSSWSRCFRYNAGATENPVIPDWIYGNRYLSQSEMENNATIIYYELKSRGWGKNAIAGILGNMQQESTINPACWQSLDYGNTSLGYGLVQWTPSTNYTNWANANGYDITNGNYQLKWIDELTVSEGQWISTSAYPISFANYKVCTESVEYCVTAFLKNFERAGTEKLEERITYGNYWYAFIQSLPSGGGTITPTPPPDTPKWIKKPHYKFFLYSRNRR